MAINQIDFEKSGEEIGVSPVVNRKSPVRTTPLPVAAAVLKSIPEVTRTVRPIMQERRMERDRLATWQKTFNSWFDIHQWLLVLMLKGWRVSQELWEKLSDSAVSGPLLSE